MIEHARVWQAPPEIVKMLPPVGECPRLHPRQDEDIDTAYAAGLSWVLCRTCVWHTDWHEMFHYIVGHGSGLLHVGEERQHSQAGECHESDIPLKFYSYPIKRGTIISLWPIAYHRVRVGWTGMSLIVLPAKVIGDEHQRRFLKKHVVENYFSKLLKKSNAA